MQYRETDFNFVSRLMEEEGIYYYFKHADGQAHAGARRLVQRAISAVRRLREDAVHPRRADECGRDRSTSTSGTSRARSSRASTSSTTTTSRSRASISQVKTSQKRSHEHADDYEMFDYPGRLLPEGGRRISIVAYALEELQAQYELAHGSDQRPRRLRRAAVQAHRPAARRTRTASTSCCRRATSWSTQRVRGDGERGHELRLPVHACSKQAAVPAARAHAEAVVQGPQTAVVVGPAGEEIYTDKYGRVKVQFHWDRDGKKDENSSCWIRVVAALGRQELGRGRHPAHRPGGDRRVPRGRPRPADHHRPRLQRRADAAVRAAGATRRRAASRAAARSAAAAGNFNELRFEDKKGAEQVYIHAEKNQDIVVENDETHRVGHDRTEKIGNDETTTSSIDRTETVGNNETITIGVEPDGDGGANETDHVAENRIDHGQRERDDDRCAAAHAYRRRQRDDHGRRGAGDYGRRVSGDQRSARYQTVNVGANQSMSVGANQSTNVGANQTDQRWLERCRRASAGTNRARSPEVATRASARTTRSRWRRISSIDAGDSVTIKTGNASITMKKDGTIVIKGKDITVEGSGKINVKASSDIVMKGSKILQN